MSEVHTVTMVYPGVYTGKMVYTRVYYLGGIYRVSSLPTMLGIPTSHHAGYISPTMLGIPLPPCWVSLFGTMLGILLRYHAGLTPSGYHAGLTPSGYHAEYTSG